ncbi:MAG: FUSC family protein [Candidatus Nanopelagicales bacterium]
MAAADDGTDPPGDEPRRSWLARYESRDRDLVALRRAARTAILMPLLFLLGDLVIGNQTLAMFASFGVFAQALLADISGTRLQRVQGGVALALAGAVLVVLGTLASVNPVVAGLSMAAVAFVVTLVSVVSSTVAGVVPALLLSFILPVSLAGPASSIPSRLSGWLVAGIAALLANVLLWPAPRVEPLRDKAATACRELAAAVVALGTSTDLDERSRLLDRARSAAAAAQRQFVSTPYRPSGVGAEGRALVGLVDQITWITTVVGRSALHPPLDPLLPTAAAARAQVAEVLTTCASILDDATRDPAELESRLAQLDDAVHAFDVEVSDRLVPAVVESGAMSTGTALEQSFRLEEAAYGVEQVGTRVAALAAAERRTFVERLLGHEPDGLHSMSWVVRRRLTVHLDWRSVWLHNSIRAAAALGVATYIATASGVQHAFWVVLGTMSVLRSNALSTGQRALRSVLGTSLGFVVGALVMLAVGSNQQVLWVLLPIAVLVAGIAPAAISFVAGQAAFTVLVVILFNLIDPVGWVVGEVRVQDVVIGVLVSLAVGLVFWPRGATSQLQHALASAYDDVAAYLRAAVSVTAQRCGPLDGETTDPSPAASAASASALRLDDAYRTYLNERGPKSRPLSEVVPLVTAGTKMRLATDWMVRHWDARGALTEDEQRAAGAALLESVRPLDDWFEALAAGLRGDADLPAAPSQDHDAMRRVEPLVEPALAAPDRARSWAAVRVGWCANLLDGVERMQSGLVDR